MQGISPHSTPLEIRTVTMEKKIAYFQSSISTERGSFPDPHPQGEQLVQSPGGLGQREVMHGNEDQFDTSA